MGEVYGIGFEDRVVGFDIGVFDVGGAESEDSSREGGVVFVVGGGYGFGGDGGPFGEEVNVSFGLVPFAEGRRLRGGGVVRLGRGGGRGASAMSDLPAALLFGSMGLLRETLDASGNGLRLPVAGGLFEEKDLIEEFFDGSGEAVLAFLQRVAYVEGFEARKHLHEESFLG